MLFRAALLSLVATVLVLSNSRAGTETVVPPRILPARAIISVHDQKLMLIENGQRVAVYPVSTSKFGIGDRWGSMATPVGWLQVADKIGNNAPVGAVFHKRHMTGEVLPPNAPGRDPIVTRIIWLRGLQATNAHAFERCIYIHGTPEEKNIGKPASYGCVRMCSKDVTQVFAQLQLGELIDIIPDSLPKLPQYKPAKTSSAVAANAPLKPAASKAEQKSRRVSVAAQRAVSRA